MQMLVGWLLALFALVGCAHVDQPMTNTTLATSSRPLFDAFMTFCVNTGADPVAAKAAVLAADGQSVMPAPEPIGSIRTTTQLFDVTVDGRKLRISAGTETLPKDPEPLSGTSCNVVSWTREDASISAIKRWVGVPGNPEGADDSRIIGYSYINRDGKREPYNEEDHVTEEGYWYLGVIYANPDMPSLGLAHYLPSPKQ